jgi:glycosyltransferase involved in cell wall biosynthesis
MTTPLVSTIIPVFNRESLLREAVHSVLLQTYRPIEIVIVDDGSTDETKNVVVELGNEHSCIVKVSRISNSGPGAAREAGRRMATGDFVQYLDSDDLLLPEKFSLQVAGLLEHPEYAISYCKTRYRNREGHIVSEAFKRTGECIDTIFPSMLLGRWWDTSTPLYRTSVTDSVGPWGNFQNEEDWEYDCRIGAGGIRLHYVPRVLSETREHSGERASDDGSVDPRKLSSRAEVHELIYKHARVAGVGESSPEMQRFSRALFLLCRQCGAVGLGDLSRRLLQLSRMASGAPNRIGFDYLIYQIAARIVGWRVMGVVSRYIDNLRERI